MNNHPEHQPLDPVRVLHCSGRMNRGGAETLLMNLYRQLDRARVQFDFITYTQDAGHYDAEIRALGGRVIALPPPSRVGPLHAVLDLRAAMRCYGPYHAVHAHTMYNGGYAMLAARLCGIPHRIIHGHNTEEEARKTLMRRLYSGAMSWLIHHHATRFLACSRAAGIYLFGNRIIESAQYSFFPNVVDFAPFFQQVEGPDAIRREFGFKEHDLLLGHVGRFCVQKNQRFLLQVMAVLVGKHENARLLLVGDGPQREEMQEYARALGIADRVVFAGVREDIPRMMRAMDVFVFPSVFEGLGIVLLEAQASGLPCVVSTAIQPEADLHLGLFHPLSLEEPPRNWCALIEAASRAPRPAAALLEQAFRGAGMTIEQTTQQLLEIYQLTKSDSES